MVDQTDKVGEFDRFFCSHCLICDLKILSLTIFGPRGSPRPVDFWLRLNMATPPSLIDPCIPILRNLI